MGEGGRRWEGKGRGRKKKNGRREREKVKKEGGEKGK